MGEEKQMIAIEAGVLARAMKHAAGIVESSQTIPILANVRLFAKGDVLQITTSDLDTELQQDLPLAVGGELATTVDARRLSALAGAVEAGAQIKMEVENKRLTVRAGRSRWVLPVLSFEDFPSLPFDDGVAEVSLSAPVLAEAIDRVLWSVSTEQARYHISGPLLHAEEGHLALVATNGNTLARAITQVAFPDQGGDAILGPKFARILGALCADAERVGLAWDAKKVRASIGAVRLTGKVIDGDFPDYRRVIPAREAQPATLDPRELRHALRRVQLVSTEKTRAVKVERGDDKMMLGVSSVDAGTAQEELPASCAAGFETGFNTQFLDRMAEAVGGDTIAMSQADGASPALFERTVPDGMLCIVMPLRV